MARELVRLGHQVTVVTIDWRSEGGRTEPDPTHVIRIDPRAWYPEFRPVPPFDIEPPEDPGRARRALRSVHRMATWGPYARWGRATLRALLARHAQHPIDVVWAIHGDDTSHEIACRFHRETGTPWVADYKDPWNGFRDRLLWGPLYWFTRRRLRTAASITETARAQAEYDARFGRPVFVVYSGYDAELMRTAQPTRKAAGFNVVYTGNISATQHDPDAIARMLGELRSRNGERNTVDIQFIGTDCPALNDALVRRGVADRAKFHPFVERREVFGLLKGADVLLMLPSTHKASVAWVGVKELEYFASGTPVLCLGSLLEEMRPMAGTQVFEARDVGAARRFLAEEIDAHSRGIRSPRRGPVNAPSVMRYSWPECAAELSRVLGAAVASRG